MKDKVFARVSPPQLAALRARADEEGVGYSVIMRAALDSYLWKYRAQVGPLVDGGAELVCVAEDLLRELEHVRRWKRQAEIREAAIVESLLALHEDRKKHDRELAEGVAKRMRQLYAQVDIEEA